MPVSPIQLYMVKYIGELHGQVTETRFWVKGHTASPASTVAAEIQGIRNEFFGAILTAFKACCNQEWHAKTLLTVQMTQRPGIFIDDFLTGGGIISGNALPSFCSGVLSLRTGITGRSRVGRLYIPGVPEDFSQDSKFSGDYLGIIQSLGSTILGKFGPSGTVGYGRIGVFSRKLGVTRSAGPPPSLSYSTAGWTQVTSFIARSEVATQRKRKLGRGQ